MMTSNDGMPFGKHTGVPIGKVPNSYLMWANDQDWVSRDFPDVAAYIAKNIGSIIVVPFGKHKDKPIDTVPASYLVWLHGEEGIEERYPTLFSWLDEHVEELQTAVETESHRPKGVEW